MDPQRSGVSPPRPLSLGGTAADGAARRLARSVEGISDLGSLERLLLSLATDEQGGGFERAHLLVWNARLECLEGRGSMPAPAAGTAPDPSAEAPRGADSIAEASQRRHPWPARRITPDQLDGAAGEAWRTGRPVLGKGGDGELPWRGREQVGAFALRRGTRAIALLVGEWERPGDPEERLARIRELASLAESSVCTLDRWLEARRRAGQAGALAEFGRAAVSSQNLAEALHLAARLAVQATHSLGSALWLANQEGALRLEITHGPAGQRERLGRGLQSLALKVFESLRPRMVERVTDEALLSPETVAQISSVAVFPLVAYGRGLAALAVYDRAPDHPSDPPGYDAVDLEFLAVLGDLCALVIDQARRFQALHHAEQQRLELRSRIAREERLAAIGELATRVASEARNPLASIGAFARRVHRELEEEDPHREYLEIVIREADRLERLIGEPLEHAAVEPLRLRVESLNTVIQEVLQHQAETLVRRRVRLLKKLAPDLPALLLDAERIRQVLANVLRNALEAVPIGGRIRVESRRAGPYVVAEVAYDGPREPGELLDQLFVPFASRGRAPGSLGLNVTQQIVREHGGEIRVRSEPEWTTILSFTLPIQDNQERRRGGSERRRARGDRRRPRTEG